jgi:hypothetical protein
MQGRFWMIAVLLIFELVGAGVASAANTASAKNLSRSEIRSMPITHRPSRPGHFYGNTVRRRHSRHHS